MKFMKNMKKNEGIDFDTDSDFDPEERKFQPTDALIAHSSRPCIPTVELPTSGTTFMRRFTKGQPLIADT